ncbi:MAG: HAD hydrolase family protein [Polyangiaceae bacterium]
MMQPFRAVAVDYDGTLTLGKHPEPDVLAALVEARGAGMKVVLVTGRMMPSLRADFPELEDYFDAVVAENGAMLWFNQADERLLSTPVPDELAAALRAREVPVDRGQVLLATSAAYDAIALQEIARLGLDCQLVRNREALMILPAGVSKGSGLFEALGDLGVSYHNAIGIGDAENDHPLLEGCEIGVAVANAISALKKHADVVLAEPNGAGIAAFLRRVILEGAIDVVPNRWRVSVGTRPDGAAATVAASRINVLIAGGSGTGKSYLAGLFAERLIRMGYSACVFDPEGDHTNLGRLRGVVTVGGRDGLPTPKGLARLLEHRFGSIVVDLSLLRPDERTIYAGEALIFLQEHRAATGLPHWIFVDEAHAALGVEGPAVDAFDPSQKGFCLVTFHPTELCQKALRSADVLFLLPESEETTRDLLTYADWIGGPKVEHLMTRLGEMRRGQALLITPARQDDAQVVTLNARMSPHVRHWHKYVHGYFAPRNHFQFRTPEGPTGRYAANVEDFHRELRLASDDALRHHAGRGDFSRWIAEVVRDSELSWEVRMFEAEGDLEVMRDSLVRVIERRYGE